MWRGFMQPEAPPAVTGGGAGGIEQWRCRVGVGLVRPDGRPASTADDGAGAIAPAAAALTGSAVAATSGWRCRMAVR
ncbi:hypothetical protein E2562_037515 [Oryza meyeriana var. granulata]|uniref:Uncharacterized protein n=1 Tax=Oryza meyeriana var. granulata TaxID=110450 RepID=A0A6G1CAF7_9ORYZ|nr:hypothetical protein E2562_037515 [Oryza meyeriana var. granulata]